MSSYDILANVVSQISRFKPFRRFSKTSKEAFAFDVTLIALSIRTGYLVDNISIAEHLVKETFSSLLEKLCETSECFNEILHLYEPLANQSFIVNRPLLVEKLELLLDQHDSSSYPVFLYLHERGDVCQLNAIPRAVLDVLELLLDKLKLGHNTNTNIPVEERTVQLPQGLVSTISIPLAAIFLDYPVAYVPSSRDQVSFFNGVPLVLYRAQINIQGESVEGASDQRGGHLLLQFSCPASLVDDSPSSTSAQQISHHLESTFGPRLTKSLPSSTLQVDYKRVTFDCVVL